MRKESEAPRDEIRRNGDLSLDEVVVDHPTFIHLEQMDKRAWWLGVTKKGKDVHIWIQSNHKGTLTVEVTENGIGAAEVLTDQRPS